MTVRAVVLPGSPLLVPGAAGRRTVLHDAREAALAALRDLVRGAHDVVVVASGTHDARGRARASLAAVGVADSWIDPVWRTAARVDAPRVAGPAASTALLALAGAGWTGPVDVVELGPQAEPTGAAAPSVGSSAPARSALADSLRRRGARLVAVESPGPSDVAALLDAFVDPAWVVGSDVSTGEYEAREYEVRRYTHRTSTRAPSRAVSP